MVGILRVAKAGWLSKYASQNIFQGEFLPFIAIYLNAVYRYLCWVNQANIQRRVCLRRWKHSCYEERKKKLESRGSVCGGSVSCRIIDLLATRLTGHLFQFYSGWYNG